jgi:hypothetical protein
MYQAFKLEEQVVKDHDKDSMRVYYRFLLACYNSRQERLMLFFYCLFWSFLGWWRYQGGTSKAAMKLLFFQNASFPSNDHAIGFTQRSYCFRYTFMRDESTSDPCCNVSVFVVGRVSKTFYRHFKFIQLSSSLDYLQDSFSGKRFHG